jgi:hypothetical protein
MQNGRAATVKLDSPGFPLAGARVGDGMRGRFMGRGNKMVPQS